jgi:hypothetical protein
MAIDKLRAEKLAEEALADEAVMRELIDGISPERKSHERREEYAEALKLLSDRHPEALYGRWDDLARIIFSDNAFSVSPVLYIIARLAAVDGEHKFDRLADQYLRLLDDKSIVVASRVARNLGFIAKARPDLEPRITARLLDVERPGSKQKELLKAHVIEALDGYFEAIGDKEAVISFVRREAESTSPRTRKAAHAFLKRHGV